MNVAKFAFAVEYFLRPFPRETERFGKRAEKFDNLCNVVVILAVLGA
jgi:hypothetical protein